MRSCHHWHLHLRLEIHGVGTHLEVTSVVTCLIELLATVLHLVALIIVVVVVLASARFEVVVPTVVVVIVLIVELHLLGLLLLLLGHVEVWHRLLVRHRHRSRHVHRHGKLLLRWLHRHGLLSWGESRHLIVGHWVECIYLHLALNWLIISDLWHKWLRIRWLEGSDGWVEV